MNNYYGKRISIFIILIGIFFIVGTSLRWNLFVNPPKHFRFYTWLIKAFGNRFLVSFNYLLGILLILFGIYFLSISMTIK